MKLNINVKLTYGKIFCDNCDSTVYEMGQYDGDKDVLVNCIEDGRLDLQCDDCGCRHQWKIAIQYSI